MNIFRIFLMVVFFCYPLSLWAQTLNGLSICIDPGHGGHEIGGSGDDRFIAETGFWESESNFEKALFLRTMLENAGATVILTRQGNDDDVADDPSLSQRVAIANTNNVEFFHSIHSNGFQGTANYTLMLYREVGGQPATQEAFDMCGIMGNQIYSAHRTTSLYVRGDYSFLGYNLGVLNGLNMPGTLSEGSFHDYIPESWRLMNSDYRKHEAHAILSSFYEFYNAPQDTLGILAGIVRDAERPVSYYYISSTNDGRAPVNNVTVSLSPGNIIYDGDNLNNGFFLFDSLTPGEYQVIFESDGYVSDTSNIVVNAGQNTFADKNLQPLTPDIPKFIRILWQNANSLIVVCDPAARASGYTVVYGRDGINFTDSVFTSDASIPVTGLETDSVYYFRVKATNQNGSSPLTQRLYAGIPSAEAHQLLIVNGFDRSTNTRFDYVTKYADPVNKRGYAFSYTMNECVESGRVNLSEFENVIWILGDESTVDHTFTPAEQSVVAAFLESGGKLFISGSEIGWDLVDKGNSADQMFYSNYLKAQYVTDAPAGQQDTYYSCTPLAGELFHGISDFNFDNGTHGTFKVDWPDAIQGIGGARNILLYKNAPSSNIAGISYEGLFGSGTTAGKLVYLGVPFEAIYPDASRFSIMERVFDFFEAPLSVTDENPAPIAHSLVLYQNYPNPFNPVTTIDFFISKPGNSQLRVYNTSGRLVQILIDDYLSAGKYSIPFNGQDLASGTYIYVLESTSGRQSRRMVLLK